MSEKTNVYLTFRNENEKTKYIKNGPRNMDRVRDGFDKEDRVKKAT